MESEERILENALARFLTSSGYEVVDESGHRYVEMWDVRRLHHGHPTLNSPVPRRLSIPDLARVLADAAIR